MMPPTESVPSASGQRIGESTLELPRGPIPFTDLTPHAHGGLGEVFRGTDPELHRTVAVKRLHDRHADNLDTRRRFLVEAEVTARLEHPGVVPVYRMFQDQDGRPAYAMRFVEGQTLAEAITAYHAGPPDPVAFRRLLQSFVQICQTVAYAHSRGVIHRDLKPANVMIGPFGETLVLDWGLAKVVGRPEEVRAAGEGETLAPSPGESDPGETAMGSAVGTPAYMSPEQAAGRWDVVSQPSDVYGLGAVMYTLLTGRPPIETGNWPEIQQKIQQGDFPRPRQAKPDIARSLEAVCLKAMARDPAARYTSAAAVATDVEHWMADEPVAAFRETLATRARRWMRRHRTVVSAAAVLLVAAVIGLSVGAVLLQRARLETDDQRKAAVTSQRKAEAINRFLVDDLLKQADPVNNPVGDKLTVRELLDKAADKLDTGGGLNGEPEVEAEIRGVIGHAYEYLGAFAKAEPHNRRSWVLLTNLHGADDRKTLAIRNRLVFVVVNQDRLTEGEAIAVEALAACDRVLGDGFAETADAALNLGEVRLRQGKPEEAVILRRRAVQIFKATLEPDDIKILESENDLGVSLVNAGRPVEAVPILQSVVDRRRKKPLNSEFLVTFSNLGGAMVAAGQFADAEAPLRETMMLSEKSVGRRGRATLSARNLLCYALEGQGKFAEAEADYKSLLTDRRAVEVGESSKHLTMRTIGFMARLYAKQEQWSESARLIAELILAEKPVPTRDIEGLTQVLSEALSGKADLNATEPLLRECATVLNVRMWKKDWLTAEVESRHGDCLRRMGKLDDARPILEKSANDVAQAVGVPAWSVAASRKRVADLYEAWKMPEEAAKWR